MYLILINYFQTQVDCLFSVKIPVLEIPTNHGDKYLFESVVICDYLDEKYTTNPLHSRDPFSKAQDRLLIERFNEVRKSFLFIYYTNGYFYGCFTTIPLSIIGLISAIRRYLHRHIVTTATWQKMAQRRNVCGTARLSPMNANPYIFG